MANTPPGGKLRVLIVEDEAIVGIDLKLMLESLGHAVIGTVASGTDAVGLASKTKPDPILMDIGLNGPMDGVAAVEKILSKIDTQVVYITAYADEAATQRAEETSPIGYLPKPVNMLELGRFLTAALGKRTTLALGALADVTSNLNTPFDNHILGKHQSCH